MQSWQVSESLTDLQQPAGKLTTYSLQTTGALVPAWEVKKVKKKNAFTEENKTVLISRGEIQRLQQHKDKEE